MLSEQKVNTFDGNNTHKKASFKITSLQVRIHKYLNSKVKMYRDEFGVYAGRQSVAKYY